MFEGIGGNRNLISRDSSTKVLRFYVNSEELKLRRTKYKVKREIRRIAKCVHRCFYQTSEEGICLYCNARFGLDELWTMGFSARGHGFFVACVCFSWPKFGSKACIDDRYLKFALCGSFSAFYSELWAPIFQSNYEWHMWHPQSRFNLHLTPVKSEYLSFARNLKWWLLTWTWGPRISIQFHIKAGSI